MPRSRDQTGGTALGLIQEAVVLLRGTALPVFVCYYIGAVPFWIGFLYFLADMSRSANAAEQLAARSLTVGLLFLWMKCWQTVFASHLRAHLLAESGNPWTLGRVWRMIRAQVGIQGWGLIVRFVALAAAFPFGWASAYYSSATVLGDGVEERRSLSSRAWEQARLRPGQVHMILIYLGIFSFIVWINVMMAMGSVPMLAKTLLGIESAASRDAGALFNSTLIAASFALANLCFDPLWKAVYVVRCFHGAARRSGVDLKVQLADLRRLKAVAVSIALGLISAIALPARAVAAAPPAKAERIDSTRLDHSIENVLERREYTWRAPRDPKKTEKKGLISSWIEDALKLTQKMTRALNRAVGWVWERFFGNRAGKGPDFSGGGVPPVRQMLYGILAVGGALLAWFLWRTRGRRSRKALVVAMSPAVPDLHAAEVTADQLPEDGWLRFARELQEQGEFRLAMRAAYLAGLANLGERQLLTIARFKSNREYDVELHRRARTRGELLAAFDENLMVFEGAWYGRHQVTSDSLGRFTANLERIRAC